MLGKLAVGATTLLVLIGVPVAAETWAGHELDQSVREAAQALAPDATVTRVEPHGRPFITSLLDGEVSSAYVAVTGPSGTTMLILQRLHRDTGRVNRVLWFSHAPQPTPLVPVRTAAGAYSPSGTAQLDGRPVTVTYQATAANGSVQLVPTATAADGTTRPTAGLPSAWTPAPVRVPSVGALTVRAVSVGEDDITIELQQTNVDTRPAPGPNLHP